MLHFARRVLRAAAVVAAFSSLAGCAFLPGFGFLEAPMLYYLPVSNVATRVACELQDFVARHRNDPSFTKWVLSEEDVKVVLTLGTDESGNVSFAGINAADFGFSSLAAFIAAQTQNGRVVPTLGAKLSLKRTKTVAITFSVSPKPLEKMLTKKSNEGIFQTENCFALGAENPINSLYLRGWLANYFRTINLDAEQAPDQSNGRTGVPKQLKITSMELSTQFLIAADLSAGLTPNVLGNGTAFIVPINGLNAGYSPEYFHKIAITMNVCDRKDKQFCNPQPFDPGFKASVDLLKRQCRVYSTLSGLLSVKPPRDYQTSSGVQMRCSKSGEYRPVDS